MIMEATNSLSANPVLPRRKIPRNPYYHKRNSLIIKNQGRNEGKSTDENMVVLKMRIKKLKVSEKISSNQGAEAAPSKDWKDWEKKIFTRYHESVFDSMELLQSYLMNTRPSLALGILTLVAMSVPLSSSVVMVNALKVARGLLAGCHVCIDIDF
ncbi:hypothetical protein BUALT_Bualt04G0087800 [Buddleja alternifolia]|uniref:Uncharacterized protein n=1 Tax=Buddleja alternifolia TaxID=168488 RepID=A0AAV6XY59_9LAMI|nr:hypothetical protein BUALT_Bualt04G0087800 [Buddleja alternifolia]